MSSGKIDVFQLKSVGASFLYRQPNSSFRPQRSGEPESRNGLELLDSRLRGNDGMVEIRLSF
jgi:hypothetical protein